MTQRPQVRVIALMVIASVLSLGGPMIQPAAASVSGRYESDITRYSNAERAKRTLVKVVKSTCLDRFAEKQARKMAYEKSLYHQKLKPILEKCKLSEVGENVAFGYPNGSAATAAWMNSPAHRRNLLDKAHRLIGVGAFQDSHGHWYVSQVLARRR